MNNYTTGLYYVQKILGRKRNESGQYLYKIKWMDFPLTQSTWQPKGNLIHAQGLVEEFDVGMDIRKQRLKSIRRAQYAERKLKQIQAQKGVVQVENKINNAEIGDHANLTQEQITKSKESNERDNNKKAGTDQIQTVKKKRGRPFKKTITPNTIDNDVNKYSSSVKANTDVADGINLIRNRRRRRQQKDIDQSKQSMKQKQNKNITITSIQQKNKHNKQMQGIINNLLDEFNANKMKPLSEMQQPKQPKQIKNGLVIDEKKQVHNDIIRKQKVKRIRGPRSNRIRIGRPRCQGQKRKRGRKPKYYNDQNMLKIQKFKIKVSKIDGRTIQRNVCSYSFGQQGIRMNQNERVFKFMYDDDYNQSEQPIPIEANSYSSEAHDLHFQHSQPHQNHKQISEQEKKSYFIKLLEQQSKLFAQLDDEANEKHLEEKLQEQLRIREILKQQDSQNENQDQQQVVSKCNSLKNNQGFIRLKPTKSYKQQEGAEQYEGILKQAGLMAQYIQRRSDSLLSNQKKGIIQQHKTDHYLNNTQPKQQKEYFDDKQDGQVENDQNDFSNIGNDNVIKPLIKIKSLRKKRSFAQIFLKNTFQGPKTNIVSGPRQKQKNYKKFENFETFQFKLSPPQSEAVKQIVPQIQHQKLMPIQLQHQLKHFDQRRQYYMKFDCDSKLQIEMINQNDQKCTIQTKEILSNCPKWLKMFYESFI